VVSDYKNIGCGDAYRIYLKINENDVITNAKYTTTGCSFSLVSLGILCQLMTNKKVDEVKNITTNQMEEYIEGYPEKRQNYIETAFGAAQKTIDDYHNGTGLSLDEVITTKKIEILLKEQGHLRGAYLSKAMIENINLAGIDMTGAQFQNTFLKGANLEGSNMEDCNLKGAYLNNANLKKANLENADLRFAKLPGVTIENTNFNNALYDIGTRVDTKNMFIFDSMIKKGKEIYTK